MPTNQGQLNKLWIAYKILTRPPGPLPTDWSGTVGICVNGGLATGVGYGGEACINMDRNGVFGSATDAKPTTKYSEDGAQNDNYGLTAGIGAKVEYSDAYNKNSLAGPFAFGEGGIWYLQGGYAWGDGAQPGERVHVISGGGTVGSPAGGTGGHSNTVVSGYLFEWCGWWICNVGNSTK